ncbi:IMPACT family member YigZ [Oxobacter pfennigii]|uniref:IMPACT family member YigZ n=1 Tax=Oxobacter pfennigii TaxID=36849 RepID=A0A0P8X2G7_9CLOT|nr:YigZ family protein [Oxobacter pfennigii]KPU45005.1 IMPACT family member YigZ [Oxobacter pfennigii]
MKEYLTILKEDQDEYIEKKSRFICTVKPVLTEIEAQDFIRSINEKCKDATHNCYAYIVTENVEIQRANDDGEPQGTAGLPILEVIKKEGLTNICVVVTRYFGGILLGAGGLVRAYSQAARKGIHKAGICRMAPYSRLKAIVNYTLYGKIQNSMSAMGNNIINVEYSDVVTMYIRVKSVNLNNTMNVITEISCGEAVLDVIENYYDADESYK